MKLFHRSALILNGMRCLIHFRKGTIHNLLESTFAVVKYDRTVLVIMYKLSGAWMSWTDTCICTGIASVQSPALVTSPN